MRCLFTARRIRIALAAVLLGSLGVLPAQAQTYTFTGNETDVKARLNIVTLTNSQVVFTFENVSSVSSKLTGIGFDMTGGTFTLQSPSPNNTPFTFTTNPGNVPQFNGASLNFALALGGSFTGGGNPNPGLGIGGMSATYSVFSSTNSFSGLTALDLANSVYFRFKAVGPNGGSDVAHALAVTPVPEPGEYAVGGMFLVTLMGLIVRARRRSAVPGQR